MENKIHTVTVTQLNNYIKKLFESVPVLNNIWIKGEISNCKEHYSGHIYFTLKDESSVVKAVMFKGSASKLSFKPENGMKILARGRVAVFERDGQYQLYIEEMQVDGVGSLYIAYEQLKARLSAEGLFDEIHKQLIPQMPSVVGVVTASTGAAVRDIIHVLGRRFPQAKVIIYPSLVQGENAKTDICRAIDYFNQNNAADVLIVGRGGGSIEDLWAFNEEMVARAIFTSKIPIISAVGHETDFTIADFVADLRAPTPSAAAEMAAPSQLEMLERIKHFSSRNLLIINRKLEHAANRINVLKLKSPQNSINDYRATTDGYMQSIIKSYQNSNLIRKERFQSLCASLSAMSPLNVLARGYSVAREENGCVIKTIEQLKAVDEFELILSNGKALCRPIK